MARGIMIVESNPISPDREDAYNTWYDNTHIPEVTAVPGIVSARRYKRATDVRPNPDDVPRAYVAIYELEADDLNEPLAEMAKRTADGRLGPTTDYLQMDPPPVVAVYETL